MQIQPGTSSVSSGLSRPETNRVPPRNLSRAAAGEAGAFVVPDSPRSRPSEALAAIESNFAEAAKPARALPRGTLVNLLV
ncbi:MAG: hypothetical protein ACKO1J_05520 [Tagaea sp.]